MGNVCAPQGVESEEAAFLIEVIRRFESGVTEGHLHTILFVGQKLGLLAPRYQFQFQQLVPFCEDLDLKIALLLWNNAVCIRDNRIRSVSNPPPGRAVASLDKLIAISYDCLKFLAAMLHLEQDLQKSRQEALAAAVRLFPVQEDQARQIMRRCGV